MYTIVLNQFPIPKINEDIAINANTAAISSNPQRFNFQINKPEINKSVWSVSPIIRTNKRLFMVKICPE